MKPRRVSISSQERRPRSESTAEVAYEPSDDPFTSAERHQLPRWREHPFAFLGGALVLVYVVGALALQAFVDVDRVREWIAPRASAALNRTVTVEDGSVGLFPRPYLRLSNIHVQNLPGFDGPTLARMDAVRLDVAWLPLLIGRVRVHRLHVDGATMHLAVDDDGTSNFGDMVPRRRGTAADATEAPLGAAVRRITVSNASLTYFDEPRNRSLAILGGQADARLSGEDDGWRAAVTLGSDSLMLRAANVVDEIFRAEGPTGRMIVSGDDALTHMLLDSGFVALAGDTLLMRGRLENMAAAEPSYELQLTNSDMSARGLAALFPTNLQSKLLPRAEGTLAVSLQVQGGLASTQRPALSGTVHLEDVTLRMRGDVVAEHVEGVIALDRERIEFDSLAGTLAGGPFELSGVVARDERATASVAARARANMDVIDALGVLPEAVTVSGTAMLDLSVAGPLKALDSLQVVGSTGFDGFQFKHDKMASAIYVPSGAVTLSGRDAAWDDLSVLVGTSRVTTSGEIANPAGFWSEVDATPRIDARLAGQSLDLDAIFPAGADDEPSYAQIAFAQISGRPIQGRSAEAVATGIGMNRLEGLPLTGSVQLQFDTLSQGQNRLERVDARLILTDSALAVSDATFDAWGGRARGSLHVGVGDAPQQPFTLELTVEDAVADRFLSEMTPIGRTVSGTLDLELELTGTVDPLLLPVGGTLVGRSRLSVTDGAVAGSGLNAALADFLESETWAGLPFEQWEAEIGIHDRVFEVTDAYLTGDFARLAASGLLDFTGAADLSLGLSVPPAQLQSVSLRRTGIGPSVVEQLRTANRPLDLGLHLSGQLAAPTLEPDAANAVALARR